MLLALLTVAQVAAGPVATCSASGDPQQRTWILERRMTRGASALDLYVDHGLEVSVEADLDPAVDLMNTDGPMSVRCAMAEAPLDGVPSEWTISVGVARSVNLFQSESGRAYAVQTISWGRELTRELGPRFVHGRFVWAIEAMPIFAQFSPASIYGIGLAPVVWRWNFTPQPRWSAFGEMAMGGMWSTEPIPADTSRGNFTAHWGAGVRLRRRGPHSVVVAYRFQHLSNGNQLGSNPGVNSHLVLIGWSYRS